MAELIETHYGVYTYRLDNGQLYHTYDPESVGGYAAMLRAQEVDETRIEELQIEIDKLKIQMRERAMLLHRYLKGHAV